MRRTTSRSSTRTSARRASPSRSKRSKRAARPRLSTRQVREIVGVLLMLAALLGVLAILSHADSILGGIRDGMVTGFGSAWFVPVVSAVALSAYLLWPKAPRPRAIDFVAGLVAVLSLVGLFGLAAGAGRSRGAVGDRRAGRENTCEARGRAQRRDSRRGARTPALRAGAARRRRGGGRPAGDRVEASGHHAARHGHCAPRANGGRDQA